jgi:hypothetical protein
MLGDRLNVVKPEVKDKISWMTFCADKKGCVFDIPSDLAESLVAQWRDGKYDTLVQATELPELIQQDRTAERGGFRGQRHTFGRGGGQRTGSWSRDFNHNGMLKRKASWSMGTTNQNQRKTF